jgi:hypothetical protein
VLSATPHFVPKGFVVTATGFETVAQLVTIAHAITATTALNVRFIIK